MKFIETLLDYEQKISFRKKSDLAKHINVKPQTLNSWLRGDANPRKKIYLERIADFFKISYDDFLNLKEQEVLGEFNLTLQEFIKLRRKENKGD